MQKNQAEKPGGARLGADMRLVSVGAAERLDDHSLEVPLVLGNAEGETVTFSLTISLEPLIDEDS